MKKQIRRLLAFVLACCISFASFGCAFDSMEIGALAASEFSATWIFERMGAGWNLGNSLDSHHAKSWKMGEPNLDQETIWGNKKTSQELIDYVASLGFKTIRVPVTWYIHTYRDDRGYLHIRTEWLERVREVVNYCLNDDLYVIIDTHHDGSLIYAGVEDAEFEQVKADAASLWTEIATYFSDCDLRLIFESYNEVDNLAKSWQFGKKAAEQVNVLNQIFVDTVRSTGGNNPERVLMVPTLLDGRGKDHMNAFVMPKDTVRDKILVTVHCYDQQYDQAAERNFTAIEEFSKRIKAKVVIGEWGSTTKYSPSNMRVTHAGNYVARANAHGLRCIYWDNGSNYGIIDRKKLNCYTDMVNAIMKPKAYESDGKELSFTEKDFLYMTIDQKTGALKEDKSWGSIVLGKNASGQIPVPKGATNMYLQLAKGGSMSGMSIHYVYFMDENDNLVGNVNKWSGFTEQTVDIPAGSAYVRVGINSSHSATSKEQYEEGFKNGDIVPYVKFR